jgi:uncharacterized low-complexity protein
MSKDGASPYEKMPTAEHVAAAFAAMKPDIVISYNRNCPEDAALGREVAKWLKERKFTSVKTIDDIMDGDMLPGQVRELQYDKAMDRVTHLINIPQTIRGEGRHHKTVRKIKAQVEENLDEWQYAVFQLSRDTESAQAARDITPLPIPSLGLWNTDAGKRSFLIRMMDLGTNGMGATLKDAGRARIGNEIDWSGSEFAHLLGRNVTVQNVTPEMVKNFDDPDRIQKIVIVDMEQSTAHGETITGAFKLEEGFQHGMDTKLPPVICNCAQCGASREAYVIDKAGEGSCGVLVIPNTRHEECDVTANISPVPGYSLKVALNEIYK